MARIHDWRVRVYDGDNHFAFSYYLYAMTEKDMEKAIVRDASAYPKEYEGHTFKVDKFARPSRRTAYKYWGSRV